MLLLGYGCSAEKDLEAEHKLFGFCGSDFPKLFRNCRANQCCVFGDPFAFTLRESVWQLQLDFACDSLAEQVGLVSEVEIVMQVFYCKMCLFVGVRTHFSNHAG